jgi:hypothetical protein
MAPEQARGEPLDQRADLFSLGSVLYALCTGRAPFPGETAVAVLYNVCQESPRPLKELNPAIPDWLVAVVEKLHEKKPADRFQSAAEVEGLLRQYLAHLQEPRSVPAPAAPERRPSPLVSSPAVPPQLARWLGREYRSKRTLWGWPLVHIATGVDPQTGRKRVARGIIAIGDVAFGVVALGGAFCAGIIAVGGGAAVGVLALGGGAALGLGLALGGGLAVGGLALGGAAVGIVAVGGLAVGHYALGGGGFGTHVLAGNEQDPAAKAFFEHFLGGWLQKLTGSG